MAKQEPALRMVAWEITRSCNLFCAHCRASAANGPYENELSISECFHLIDEILEVGKPIIILIDTPGAYPGIGAEERGQAEAIARNIREMSVIEVPIIIAIIGEGASGGALGIGVGDIVLMLENSWYSVISPEGCSAILWKKADDPKQVEQNKILAADALKPTPDDLMLYNIIDDIVPEPIGGAHRDHTGTAVNLKKYLIENLKNQMTKDVDLLLADRLARFRALGVYKEG